MTSLLCLSPQIVPPIEISLDDLRKYDGSDESLPMYLAIQGVIFDVSKAKQFYGPDGMLTSFLSFWCQKGSVSVSLLNRSHRQALF